MGNLLYVIAAALVIIWALEFLVYRSSGLVHVLLVVAIVAFLIRLVRGKRAL
jgi:hypothetical protein